MGTAIHSAPIICGLCSCLMTALCCNAFHVSLVWWQIYWLYSRAYSRHVYVISIRCANSRRELRATHSVTRAAQMRCCKLLSQIWFFYVHDLVHVHQHMSHDRDGVALWLRFWAVMLAIRVRFVGVPTICHMYTTCQLHEVSIYRIETLKWGQTL